MENLHCLCSLCGLLFGLSLLWTLGSVLKSIVRQGRAHESEGIACFLKALVLCAAKVIENSSVGRGSPFRDEDILLLQQRSLRWLRCIILFCLSLSLFIVVLFLWFNDTPFYFHPRGVRMGKLSPLAGSCHWKGTECRWIIESSPAIGRGVFLQSSQGELFE